MTEKTAQVGLLMEAAEAQQKLSEALLKALKTHIQGLDAVVREEIRRTLIDELRAVHLESQRAATALLQLQRVATFRIGLWSAGIAAGSTLITLGLSRWILG
jgi:hypothetical protein